MLMQYHPLISTDDPIVSYEQQFSVHFHGFEHKLTLAPILNPFKPDEAYISYLIPSLI